MPPRLSELGVCFAVDVAAGIALVYCFPPLNAWPMWLLGIVLILIGFLLTYGDLRGPLVELMEPIMPIRTDGGRQPPAPGRELARGLSRGLAVICSLVIVWDVAAHSRGVSTLQPEPAAPDVHDEAMPDYWDEQDHYPDKWSADSRLMLRWQASAEFPGEKRSLELAAQALGLETEKLASENLFPELRILLFRFLGPIEAGFHHHSVSERWQEFVVAPQGELASFMETKFPPYLDAGLCLSLPHYPQALLNSSGREDGQEEEDPQLAHIHYVLNSVNDADGRLAYAEACRWWRQKEFPEDEEHYHEGYDGPGYDPEMLEEHMRQWDDEAYTDEAVEGMKSEDSDNAPQESEDATTVSEEAQG